MMHARVTAFQVDIMEPMLVSLEAMVKQEKKKKTVDAREIFGFA